MVRIRFKRKRYCLANVKTVLKSHHEESEAFMPKLIAFFDGEKDPRNLMIVFSIWNVVMVEWDVAEDAQVCLIEAP